MSELPTTSDDALQDNDILVDNKLQEDREGARLEAEVKLVEVDGKKAQFQDIEPDIEFKCEICGMDERVHYFGQTPPFAWGVSFLEDTYVLRDPFQPPIYPRHKPKAEYFIAMGAKCESCQRIVCKDVKCSFFYTRTYCLQCAEVKIAEFPNQVQTKLSKQLVAACQ